MRRHLCHGQRNPGIHPELVRISQHFPGDDTVFDAEEILKPQFQPIDAPTMLHELCRCRKSYNHKETTHEADRALLRSTGGKQPAISPDPSTPPYILVMPAYIQSHSHLTCIQPLASASHSSYPQLPHFTPIYRRHDIQPLPSKSFSILP